MKNRLLKTFTSLVLTVLMVISVMPAFAITIGAAGEKYTWTRVTSVETLTAGGTFIIGYEAEADANSGVIIPMANTGSATTSAAGFMYSGAKASSGGEDTLNMNTYNAAGDEFIVTIAESEVNEGKITIKTADGYIGNTNTKNKCKLFTEDSTANGTSFTATIGANNVITLNNGNAKYHTFQYNTGSPRFACYGDTQKNLVIYKRTLSAETPACEHKNTTSVAEAPATCTTDGTAAGVYCNDCKKHISGHEVLKATGHKYDENGNCTACGAKATTLTISEALTHETTEFDKFYVTGTITSITNPTYGNMYIEDAEGKSIMVYGLYSADGSVRYDAMQTKPVVGDTIKVLSVIGSYKDVNQLKDAWLIEHAVAAPTVKSVSLSLNKGVTVKVKINIPANWNYVGRANVVFSNGMSFEAIKGEQLDYSVDLTPAQINDALTVKITDAEGKTLVAEKDVSVRAYMDKAEEAGASDELIALLDAALTYSSVADGTYKGEDFTNEFNGVADHTHSGELFTGFAGQLGTYASIFINVDTANVPDGETLVLTVGGTEIINGNIDNYITQNHQIVITGLFPANFDDTIEIEASTECSMAEFSFNSYLKAIYTDDSSTQKDKNLAVATYLYGLKAEAYLATLQ